MTPGEIDNAKADLARAAQALRVGRSALGDDALEDATSRIYYGAFHAARAALTVAGLHSRTHAGLIHLFRTTYGDADFLGPLLEKRARADYSTESFAWTTHDVASWADQVERFIERCSGIVASAAALGPNEPDPPADV